MNRRLSNLIYRWKADGTLPQETFNWNSSKENWIATFPNYSDFLENKVPIDLGREEVRAIFENQKIDIDQKFLASMIWGYGNIGYGPYRVSIMFSQKDTIKILHEVYEIASEGLPKEAYIFLKKNRIRILGPSFGTKFLTFCTPREIGAPIYDFFVSVWIKEFATKEFSNVSTSSENWNLKTYSKYWDWVKEHSDELNCYPDEIELAIFRDAENKFSKSSNWSGK